MCSHKWELGGAGHLGTVLYLNCQPLLELTQGMKTHPKDTADQLETVRKPVSSSYTGYYVNSTLVNTSWQRALGYVELEPVAFPKECLGWVGDNHVSVGYSFNTREIWAEERKNKCVCVCVCVCVCIVILNGIMQQRLYMQVNTHQNWVWIHVVDSYHQFVDVGVIKHPDNLKVECMYGGPAIWVQK